MDEALLAQSEDLAANLPRVISALQKTGALCMSLAQALKELNKHPRSSPVVPLSLPKDYQITKNGLKRYATRQKVDTLRKTWSGNFLLDIPDQTLRIRIKKKDRTFLLTAGDIHQRLVRILLIGMKNPGQIFGTKFPSFLDISEERTLSRYIYDLRKYLDDPGRKPQIILKTNVYPEISNSGYGYLFSEKWQYLVIEKNI